jgi:predicted site-specific integrase-resolvase
LEQNIFYAREEKLLKRITEYILENHKGKITPVQKKRLKEIVYNRVSGLIRKDKFEKQIALSLAKGGVGLGKKAAHNITYYFEKIIIQGIESKGHGH